MTLVMLVALPILTIKGVEGLTADWEKSAAKPIEHSEIQKRIREREPEFFYKITYTFTVENKDFRISEEQGFRTIEAAQKSIADKMNQREIPIWYSANNPEYATLEEVDTYGPLYFIVIGILILSFYFKWLFLKYQN